MLVSDLSGNNVSESPGSIQPAGGSGESGETLPVGHAFAGHGGPSGVVPRGQSMENLRKT